MFKKCKYFLLLLMVLIPFKVNADHIYGVKMEVFINKEGNASIKETWKVKADSGSEWYKQILNLGESKLTNFKVSSKTVASVTDGLNNQTIPSLNTADDNAVAARVATPKGPFAELFT